MPPGKASEDLRRELVSAHEWDVLPVFTARGGNVYLDNHKLVLKGISWFGADGSGKAPDGLWLHNADFYMKFLSKHGFNALRLPFALDNVLADVGPGVDMLTKAPDLVGLGYLDVLEKIVIAAARHGLLVLFDLQRLDSAVWPDDGLWYSPRVTIQDVKNTWDRVQARFCKHWNALGADLLNEPHGARWGDWAQAASDLGSFVLSKCPRWVVFVEGVAHEGKNKGAEYFWGENLEHAAKVPVRVPIADKVIYSPHVYGPGDGDTDHRMPYFK